MNKDKAGEIFISQKDHIKKCREYLAEHRTASAMSLVKSIVYNHATDNPIAPARQVTAVSTIRSVKVKTKKPPAVAVIALSAFSEDVVGI